MNGAVVGEDGSEMTARENFMLRLDAEAEGDYRISDEEAVGTVLSFASGGVGRSSGVQTFSADGVNIKGIKPLRDRPMMLAAVDDRSPVAPLVVEFDGPEGDGFAVCSGDKRYEKVFCYVPKGDIADTTKIEMIKHFYRSVENDINDSIARFNAQVDSLYALGRIATYAYSICPEHGTGLQDGMFCMGEEFIGNRGENYIGMKTKWKQEDPYNKYMEIRLDSSAKTSHDRVIVGCVPIALGQAMAFKKHDCFDAISATMWNAINNISDITGTQYEDVVALYLKDLAYRLRIRIRPSGTGSNETKMLQYLDSIKNTHAINYDYIDNPKYTTTQEKESILNLFVDAAKKKDPIIIMSNAKTPEGISAHAFVIEGVKYAIGELYEVIGNEYGGGTNKMYNLLKIEDYLLVRCNWGWGGDSDGLYDYTNLRVEKYDYTFEPIRSITRLK